MRILVSNDDGILAHGLECLTRAASPLSTPASSLALW